MTKMWNINAPQGHIRCAIFTIFAQFVPHFRCVSCYNLVGFARWVMELLGFQFESVRLPPNFQRPLAAKLCVRPPKRFRGARTCSASSIAMPRLVGLGFHRLLERPKHWVFVWWLRFLVALCVVCVHCSRETCRMRAHECWCLVC